MSLLLRRKKSFLALLSRWSIRILQDDIIKGIMGRSNYSRNEIFDNHLLDFEDVYRDQGWSVMYDGPAYCESYDPYFLFKKAVKKDNR